jgi:hypothetical protein
VQYGFVISSGDHVLTTNYQKISQRELRKDMRQNGSVSSGMSSVIKELFSQNLIVLNLDTKIKG